MTVKTTSGTPVEVKESSGVYTFIMPAANVTVSADYEVISYGITYHLNGGVNASENPDTYTVEDEVVLQTPTKEGASFLGWTYEGVTEPVKEAVIPAGSIGNKSFTAHWENEAAPHTFHCGQRHVSAGRRNCDSDSEQRRWRCVCEADG